MNNTNQVTSVNNNPDAPVSETVKNKQAGKAVKGKIRVTEDQVTKTRKYFANLKPAKKKVKEVKSGFSGQEFVKEVFPEILAASKMGYTMIEIAEMLTNQAKVTIPPATLKNYVSRAKAERKKETKGEPEKAAEDTTPLAPTKADDNT